MTHSWGQAIILGTKGDGQAKKRGRAGKFRRGNESAVKVLRDGRSKGSRE